MNLEEYFPVLMFIIIGILVGVAPQVLGRVLGPHRPDEQKLSAYECGFEAFGDARLPAGVITGAVGAPVMLWLLVQQRRGARS